MSLLSLPPKRILSLFLWSCLLVPAVGNDAGAAVEEEEEEEWRAWQNCDIMFGPSVHFDGWGVFAAKNYSKGDMVEMELMTIPMPNEVMNKTILNDYAYFFNTHTHVIFGHNHFFNHQAEPNLVTAFFPPEFKPSSVVGYLAARDIVEGEELFAN